jgi:hypothetical protein
MSEEMVFDDREKFLGALRKLAQEKDPESKIRYITPFNVPEVDQILTPRPGKVRYFALIGAATGTIAGFAFTILTSLSWPIITGGKPIVSIAPFIIIAFALTILFGALSSFAGFLFLSRLPSVENIISEVDYGNKFVIIVDKREA